MRLAFAFVLQGYAIKGDGTELAATAFAVWMIEHSRWLSRLCSSPQFTGAVANASLDMAAGCGAQAAKVRKPVPPHVLNISRGL